MVTYTWIQVRMCNWIVLIKKSGDLFWSVSNGQLHFLIFLVLSVAYHTVHWILSSLLRVKRDQEHTEVTWVLLNRYALKIVLKSCITSLVFLLFWRTSTRISISSASVWHACAGLVTQHRLCCQTLQVIYTDLLPLHLAHIAIVL